jgi:hypothetical protein
MSIFRSRTQRGGHRPPYGDVRSGFEFLGKTSEERARIAAIISRTPEPSSARRLRY